MWPLSDTHACCCPGLRVSLVLCPIKQHTEFKVCPDGKVPSGPCGIRRGTEVARMGTRNQTALISAKKAPLRGISLPFCCQENCPPTKQGFH